MRFASFALVFALTARPVASGHVEHEPPTIPEYWHSTGIQYISSPDAPPPFPHNNGVPAAPYTAGRMETFYDWSQRGMIEHYLDACVPIFPEAGPTDPGFECSFINFNETSFLVTYNETRPSWALPCCVFGKPWHPPKPDFLANLTINELAHTSPVNGTEARWYEVPIDPPTGPFYYAWTLPFVPSSEFQNYAVFDFPGIGSWVNQNFVQWTHERPPLSTWSLPEEQCGTDVDKVPACPSSLAIQKHPWHVLSQYAQPSGHV